MSRTESTMVQLGTPAPSFELQDVITGRDISLDTLFAPPTQNNPPRGLLVMFVCPHCPYVLHIEQELGRLGRDYLADGALAIVAIMSNDTAQFPQDGPAGMRTQAERCGWTFPYLLDASQEIARAYDAACTPDLFLFNADRQLAYRGQLDGSRPRRGDFGNDEPVTGRDLRAAVDAVLAGDQPNPDQRSSIGCNIKWREPQHA